MTVGSSPTTDDDRYWVNFGSVPGDYLYESGGIRRGMWTVSWFRDLVGSDERTLEAEAALVPPGCNGLVAVMDWLAPADAPHRRGALIGFDGSQGSGAIYRAILEGIAMTMHGHVKAMEDALGRRFTDLVASGGGSQSPLMLQILADVFNLPTRPAAVPDAAGLGAAVCAAVGSGLHATWTAAVDGMVGRAAPSVPSPKAESYRPVVERHDLLCHSVAAMLASAS